MLRTVMAVAIAAGLFAAPAMSGSALAQTAPAAANSTEPAKPEKAKRPMSAGMKAFIEREKKCGAEWKAAKAAGKVDKAMTWPKFLSACNKRLKAGG